MSTPVKEIPEPEPGRGDTRSEHADNAGLTKTTTNGTDKSKSDHLTVDVGLETDEHPRPSPSQTRERAHRIQDELAMLEIEREVSNVQSENNEKGSTSGSIRRSRSRRSEPVDEFDAATQPLHDQAAVYRPPDNPTTSFAVFFKKIHESSFVVRYLTYIVPVVLLLLIPLLVGALAFPNANVGGVQLLWFAVWLEIFWLTLWAGRVVAKCIPAPLGIVASLFTNNAKKWRDMGKQLELPASLFFWFLAVEISFLPTMKNHHTNGDKTTKNWETIVNKIIIALFVGFTLNFIEKIIIQLIAISFHLRTYADRIEINKFQIGSLGKLYAYSKERITVEDREFEEAPQDGPSSGTKTPLQYADKAQRAAREAFSKFGDVAGVVAGDFTGRKSAGSKHPHQVVLALLASTSGSQVLARRLYRTFVREGFETVFAGDLKSAFDNEDEAEAAFTMFDKDMNGDISMEELEAACVEIGRERKSITASLKDLDSVVSKLDDVFMFIVFIIFILVLLSLISSSTAGVLASAGSTLLALSWLFSATAQEFLQSVIFVFVKHPFDVGDRVTIYGNTGTTMTGDDYFVKEIALLYTEFKKMQGHVVQAPNSYLNTLFILNQRRSGALAEAVPVTIRFGTTLEQIDMLRMRLLEFVRSEKREYQGNILTELREVTENYSITLNVVFFYKSNWQNELLRLQRRNKFICHLMLTLQEVGIEGPRMNAVGARQEVPYYLNHQGAPPSYQSHADDSTNPPSDPNAASESRDGLGSLPASSMQHHPSILRRGTTSSSMRNRSGSNAKKHVDFSLGMSEFSSGDILGDVYADRGGSRVDQVVRNANRESAERREEERRLEEEQRRASAEASSRGRPSQESHRTANSHGNTSLLSPGRPSASSSVHRNRFLSRMGGRSRDGSAQSSGRDFIGEDDLMEQGRYTGLHPEEHTQHGSSLDPRSHSVSTRAVNVHDDYGPSSPFPAAERSRSRDAELRRPEEHEMASYRAPH